MDRERSNQIGRVAWIAIVGNTLLALLKTIAGLMAGSLAVLGDGIDSTTDIVASIITLFAARIISKPPDREHPYGHFRAETIATKTLAFVIFFVGAQLALSTARRILSGEYGRVPELLAIYVTVISILGKIILAFLLTRAGKKLQSSMLLANGKNMQNDILISAGVLVGLVFTQVFRLPLVDSITALAISLWIMKTAFGIFMEANLELMDGNDDPLVYSVIFQAVENVSGAANPHRARVRRLANMYIIDLDIEVESSKTVAQAHDIAIRVEQTIKGQLDNVYDIMVHVEPLGNVETEERYGLRHNTDS